MSDSCLSDTPVFWRDTAANTKRQCLLALLVLLAFTQSDFTYYATREITLTKDGYETQTVMQKVKTPWYQVFPLDAVSDNLLPFEVTNRHDFTYQLQPKVVVPTEELLNRGNMLRNETQIGQ